MKPADIVVGSYYTDGSGHFAYVVAILDEVADSQVVIYRSKLINAEGKVENVPNVPQGELWVFHSSMLKDMSAWAQRLATPDEWVKLSPEKSESVARIEQQNAANYVPRIPK